MIQLKRLDSEIIEVSDSDLGAVVGGLFGGTYFSPPPAPRTQYNTPSIIPTLPAPGSYTPEQALQNLGISYGDGQGNIYEIGPGRASYEYNGTGVGIQWNGDSIGGVVKFSW